MKKVYVYWIAFLLWLQTVLGCAMPAQRSLPVINDPGTPPAHVLASVQLYTDSSGIICTAVAFTPRLALTAAHCARASQDSHSVVWLVDGSGDQRTVRVMWPDMAYDIAVLRIDVADTDMPDHMQLARADMLAPYVGEPVSMFGFGCNTGGKLLLMEHPGVISKLLDAGSWTAYDYKYSIVGMLGINGHACRGDSGGPVIRTSGRVLAIMVGSNPNEYVVSVPVWLDGFIQNGMFDE